MIAQAFTLNIGSDIIDYITGEAARKEHPEKIFRVDANLLSPHLSASGIRESMKLTLSRFSDKHPRLKKNLIHLIISPSKEYTENFTIEDWRQLWRDFVEELDKILRTSGKTNIANSKYIVCLHEESKSENPHLHGAICALDNNGEINDTHYIGLRAQQAAEAVAKKREWKTAEDIHKERIPEVTNDCINVLRSMNIYNLQNYLNELKKLGYEICTHPDKNGIVHGYSLIKDRHNYKGSELGTGRNLMISKLFETWQTIKGNEQIEAQNVFSSRQMQSLPQCSANVINITKDADVESPENDVISNAYELETEGSVPYTIQEDDAEVTYYIPEDVFDFFNEEFDESIINWEELSDFAVKLFVGYFRSFSATSPSEGGGGGEQNNLPWRDKDEDDIDFARRCANAARQRFGVRKKGRKL